MTATTYASPYALGALQNAAQDSVALLIQNATTANGRIHADPLHRYIQGDGQASPLAIDLTEQITGQKIERGTEPHQYQNTAPACRAALRRWAMREGVTR